ncbi:hypothetical protein B0A55_00678 [Friedmanniomyces simplex]|uniref:Uncharacterized protein n=1 Tax=Friedmanniomyces simplex TaxID=329884 RepID=A0A4U0XYR9_9PEZI|nr:hypothetical protein B0A55_00678 [Friedmanniomyces simplex]
MRAVILAPFLGFLAAFAAADDEATCANKNPSAVNAIGKFCQKTNIVIPSAYGNEGTSGYNRQTHVSILGNCKPAQWVPQQYCLSQLYQICAVGGKHGAGTANYGNVGCQHWKIWLRNAVVK